MRLIIFSILILKITSAYSQMKDSLPQPYATSSSINFSNVIGWKDNEAPVAPEGFTVSKFASDLDNPRWLCETPDGDILVAESNSEYSTVKKVEATVAGASKSNNISSSANIILRLTDANHDGIAESKDTFLAGLHQPFGMLFLDNWFYVANSNALWRYPYEKGDKKITGKGQKLTDLAAGDHPRHWTRNIIANKNKTKIYISVGSNSDHGEKGLDEESLRANILEINPDGTGKRIYASGLRNPAGMDWEPGTSTLWTSVNERDELGDNLVPDYITSVKDGGFYGWPYTYSGQHPDPRVKDQAPELVKNAIVPDFPVGAHTASLGFRFCNSEKFPVRYRNGAFVSQHGSWNRSELAGYKVLFVPFKNGKAVGPAEDFLTGFVVDQSDKKVHGRPVGIIFPSDGSLLVADDASNTVWKISAKQ